MRMFQCPAAFLILLAVSLNGQLNRGSLTGVVADTTGAVVPQVRVTIQNTGTGATYQTTTNDAGQYIQPNLPAGSYQITFEAVSFKTLVRSGVSLGATEVLRVDAVMEVGAVTESVSVQAAAPRLQTEAPEVGTSLPSRELTDLPLTYDYARKVEVFAYKISPGVYGGNWTSYINGSTAFSKESILDGASMTTYMSGEASAHTPSIEALEEVKIQTSGMSAEFGRTQTGIFNYVFKSGSNDVHGSAFGSLRNEALNANTFANKFLGLNRARDREQDYAFSFGGPVYIPAVYNGRNRTFFYTALEPYRYRNFGFRAPDRTVPVPEFYDGDFSRLLGPATGQVDALGRSVPRGAIYDPATFSQLSGGRWIGDPFPGNRIPVSRVSQVSQRMNAIAKQYYLPTVRDASGQFALVNNTVFPVANNPSFDNYQFSIKADQIISNHHKLSGSYSRMKQFRGILADQGGIWSQSDSFGGPLSAGRTQSLVPQYARLAHDWTVSPRVLNHVTLFYNFQTLRTYTLHQDVDGAKELAIRGLSTIGFPRVNWGGGPFVTQTSPGDPARSGTNNISFGLLDTVSFSRGRHFMKAGLDVRRNHYNVFSTQGGTFNFAARGTAIPNEAFSGNLSGYAFASYLLGIVDSAALSDPVTLGGRRYYYALFFQDDFKVSSRLTLQLGMRWEYQPPYVEVADRLSSWSPNKIDPESGLPGAYEFAGNCRVCTGQRYFGRRSLRDWGPRIGFAYHPFEKWTVRGGYGILYEGDLFNNFSATPLGKPTNVQWGGTYALSADPVQPWKGIFNWDNGFPNDRFVPPVFDTSWGNRNRPGMIDPNYGQSPYIQAWNLNIQREVLRNLVVDVGYVGNKATRLRAGELVLLDQLPASALAQFGRNLNNAVRNPADAAANGIPYPYPGFAGTVASALRPYPQVQGNQTVSVYGFPVGFSTYHSLQVTVNRQFSQGLTTYANYTWSKNLANVRSSMIGDNSGPLDYYNLRLEKAVSDHDVPHMFKAYVDYELPFGRRKRIWGSASKPANAILGGWSVSAILNYFSGTPLAYSASFPLAGGWNGAFNRPNIAAGDLKAAGFERSAFELSNVHSAKDTYLNKSLFSDPAPLTLGTAAPRYAQARNFGTINEDFGFQKDHRIREKVRFQLRAELLNAFNRHQLGGIVTNVTDPLFGQVTGVSGNRAIQLGARVDF